MKSQNLEYAKDRRQYKEKTEAIPQMMVADLSVNSQISEETGTSEKINKRKHTEAS